MTASACLEQLSTCHLNQYSREEVLERYYSVTRPNRVQLDILKSLGLLELTDNRKVMARIAPRDA